MACSSSSSPPDTTTPSTSTSTSTTEHHHIYDVFINHRGPDVKKNIASHLYHRLLSYGLRVFLDQEELQQGENLTSQIVGAIATASVHVAIFSPKYAESKWCLDELVLMLNSGTPIIPVFYGVKPAELRWTQSKDGVYSNVLGILEWWARRKEGTYEHALLNLGKKKTIDPQTNKEKPRYEANAIEKWRTALSRVAEISGFELEACNSDEGQLLNKVVEQVQRIVPKAPLNVAEHPTGLKEKLEDLDNMVLLQQHSRGAQVVGIVGLGGIGKTTLAKEFFNSRRASYQASCFLFDIREAAGKGSLPSLQTQLLSDLNPSYDPRIQLRRSMDEGIGLFKRYLSSSQALVILDDVDHASQLDALVFPVKDVLYPGSLILVTSRNKDLLAGSGIVASSIYNMKCLDRRRSKELFCSHAFHQPYPFVGFEEMVAKFLHACDGLPLSLKVIGALLRGKEDLEYWKAQFSKISKALPCDIRSKLKISYDSLDEEEKNIFLDIACFFVGQDRDTVKRVSEGSGWEGSPGILNLENKCLVEVDSGNCIRMHDHLRDLGRYLAENEPPGCLRRLWRPIDNLSLQNVPDQLSVRGICMAQRNSESSAELKNRPIADMSRLQLLRAEGDCVESIFSLGYSSDLIWLCWDNYPYSMLPPWLLIKNLRVLQVSGWQPFETFWQSESEAPLKLRELNIRVPLSELPNSVGQLKHLERIELREGSMVFLPNSFGNLTNLQYLDLSWSCSLQELPDSFGNLIRLKHLCLAGCSELSISEGMLGNITTLVSLDLSFCLKMKELPLQVSRQRFLEKLNLLGTGLRELQGDIGKLGRLETLKLGSPFLKTLPASLGDRTTLTELILSDCRNLECLPDSFGMLKQLTKMEITSSEIQYLPLGVREMNNLEYLRVDSTPLLSLPFMKMDATGTELSTKTVINRCMVGLKALELHKTKISHISFLEGICPNLQHLKIEYCDDLEEVGALPTSLITLEMLFCGALRKIGGLGGLAKLQQLDISWCKQVKELPSLESLTSLEELQAVGCKMLKGIRGLAHLPNLRLVEFRECSEMKELSGIEYMRSLKEFADTGYLKLHADGEVQEMLPVHLPEKKVQEMLPVHLPEKKVQEMLPVHLPEKKAPGKEPRGDEKLHALDYTIDNYFGMNTNDSCFDISEFFMACDTFYGFSEWLKVM